MEIRGIVCGQNMGIFINSYFLIKNRKTVIIDPFSIDEVQKFIEKNNLIPQFIILTHAHIDHIKDLKLVSDLYKIPVYMCEKEKEIYNSNDNNLSNLFSIPFQLTKIKKYLRDGEEIDFEGEKLKIIHTPGHTPGSICILAGNILITGDTLFASSVGRTDFPYGDEKLLFKSIREKLFKLDDDIIVYPGHNQPTTIGREKKNW